MHLLQKKNVRDNELFPARKRLTLCAWAVDSFCHQHFWNGGNLCSLFSMYRTKFDVKMTKLKWNYTVNMIMNVPGTVLHTFWRHQPIRALVSCSWSNADHQVKHIFQLFEKHHTQSVVYFPECLAIFSIPKFNCFHENSLFITFIKNVWQSGMNKNKKLNKIKNLLPPPPTPVLNSHSIGLKQL